MSRLYERLRAFLRTRAEQTYLVGGTVRDVLLGRALHDADVAVLGNAANVARTFADKLGAAFYVMDETFDVARVIWDVDGAREVADFARVRGDSIENDLRTRDFTINAMAADANSWEGDAASVIDPLHGLDDLRAGRIRAVADDVFQNDAVRLVRAVRFEAELQFVLDDVTAVWVQRDAALVAHAPMERVRDEWLRTLGADNVLRQLRRCDALGLLGHMLPEVNAMRGVTQSQPHIYDVFEHSLHAVAAAEEAERAAYLNLAEGAFGTQLAAYFAETMSGVRTRRELLRLTLLLHDIGKPATRTVEASGRIRYFGHAELGVMLVEPALRRLKFSNDEVAWVKTIMAHHLRPILLAQNGASLSKRAVHHFFRDTGADGVAVAVHAWCDQRATYGENMPREIEASLQAVIGQLLDGYYHAHAQVVAPPTLVNGTDVMAYLELVPGPQVRVVLDAVREAQAEGLVQTRAEALAFLQECKAKGEKL